ncbi:MAG: PKD domain-containing protein [Phycisphaerae bacterium]
MASGKRRIAGGWTLCTLAAIVAAGLAPSAQAEARKFCLMLADLPKERAGPPGVLPNRNDVYDRYFDKVKNAWPENTGVRVDSFAEWWEEVSYGDVTVSGDVFGWFSLPWPSRPTGFNGETGFGSQGRIPHVDLQGGNSYQAGSGESFNPFNTHYKYDIDGVGGQDGGDRYGNFSPFDGFFIPGLLLGAQDLFGLPLYIAGERFRDLNGNRAYDAGVPEWGIDKNNNGRIDVDPPGAPVRYNARSFDELFAANIQRPAQGDPDQFPPRFVAWSNETEWYDSNRDGQWNRDGFAFLSRIEQFPTAGAPVVVRFWRGDWGGAEILIEAGRDQPGMPGQRAEPDTQAGDPTPPPLWRYLVLVTDPQQRTVKWYDEQWNNNYDFPEPFEDYLRRWDAGAHDWIRVSEAYIRANFPGDADAMVARVGNRRYDAPNAWNNNGNVNSNNKMQPVQALLLNAAEAAEQDFRNSRITPEPDWLTDFWNERYGTEPPQWDPSIPYLRKVDPAQPRPQRASDGEVPQPTFEANGGGPKNDGRPYFDNVMFTGTILPDPGNRDDGFYDGMAEYDDLAPSIYHSAGDQYLGNITSTQNNAIWGQDIGGGNPSSVFPDGVIPAAGPLAFNVHGDGGFDGGNALNLEVLTWRTDGSSLADTPFDFNGDGIPDFVTYHRDLNLDGLLDLGETPGDRGTVGLITETYANYGVDPDPGTPPNGGPQGLYPWNRHRLIEDCVAALDESVDWDDFITGEGPFGEVVSGMILTPAGTGVGMFSLPAPALNYLIRTRDRINPNALGTARYVPYQFFDGLGIGLNDGAGEGGNFDVGFFHLAFACHEYGHSWESFPDLYDYDVYRDGFTGAIINNPIGAWCVMAGGGIVHPVPILKAANYGGRVPWLTPVDITNSLNPAGITQLTIRSWEFDRDKTVFVYTNPLYDGEQFWLWRNSPGTFVNGALTTPSFDRFQPGFGLMIMHIDNDSQIPGNPEGLPPQQRLESHFVYTIVQADGNQNLEAGENFGDDGDPFPGSANQTTWNRTTDPSNRWYSGQGSGLDITNIVQNANSSTVTFRWTPRELPSLDWIQPPGGTSVGGLYSLRYFAYDQFGGTTIEFFAFRNEPEIPLNYDNGIPLGSSTKAPGEVDGVYRADVSLLPDGTYTFYARLVPGVGADNRQENSHSLPRGSINNAGNGSMTVDSVDLAISKFEVWTIRCVAGPVNNEEWEITGSVSGVQTGRARTGQPYTSDTIVGADLVARNAVGFTISSGNIPFRVGDQFTFLTTGLTAHSAAVLVDEGEVVQPLPPIAMARVESGGTSGLAPHTVVFKHDQSSDPRGAVLNFRWDFGDGSEAVVTGRLDQPVPHTYTIASPQPYIATLTVTNSFGLFSQATVPITVFEALGPTVRITADPVTGVRPLRVRFTGDLTTDPNPGTQGLDYAWDFGDNSGIVTTANAEHVYQAAGIYRATLTVTNRPYGKSSSRQVEIRVSGPPANQRPTAVIDVDKRSGVAPLTVLFSGARSSDPENGPLTYTWNFGDGSPVVRGVAEVERTFTRSRAYDVTLTVVDDSNQSDSATFTIVVTDDATTANAAPVARIRASGTQGAAPFSVSFDATASTDPEGGPLSYAWDFGDGSEQVVGGVVQHTYTTPQRYTVVLSVADAQGGRGAASIEVVVTSPSGGGQSGQGLAPTDSGGPDVAACGAGGCGPVGMMPMMLTLIGIGGIRRFGRRIYR